MSRPLAPLAADDPLLALRAAAARTREVSAAAVADLDRQRADVDREHRAHPSYGAARRRRSGGSGGDPEPGGRRP